MVFDLEMPTMASVAFLLHNYTFFTNSVSPGAKKMPPMHACAADGACFQVVRREIFFLEVGRPADGRETVFPWKSFAGRTVGRPSFLEERAFAASAGRVGCKGSVFSVCGVGLSSGAWQWRQPACPRISVCGPTPSFSSSGSSRLSASL